MSFKLPSYRHLTPPDNNSPHSIFQCSIVPISTASTKQYRTICTPIWINSVSPLIRVRLDFVWTLHPLPTPMKLGVRGPHPQEPTYPQGGGCPHFWGAATPRRYSCNCNREMRYHTNGICIYLKVILMYLYVDNTQIQWYFVCTLLVCVQKKNNMNTVRLQYVVLFTLIFNCFMGQYFKWVSTLNIKKNIFRLSFFNLILPQNLQKG